ncbi:hypothetical protein D3C76_1524920 [compost metagenome]
MRIAQPVLGPGFEAERPQRRVDQPDLIVVEHVPYQRNDNGGNHDRHKKHRLEDAASLEELPAEHKSQI